MDPDTALDVMRRMVGAYPDGGFDAQEFVEAVDALDTWLTKGGFLPRGWSRNR